MSKRQKVTNDISAKLMFESARTCCVCNDANKSVHIHHIDNDASNSNYTNLIVLCLECHNKAHTNGGFVRKWSIGELKRHKTEWIKRVKKRKNDADKFAAIQTIQNTVEVQIDEYDLNDVTYITPENKGVLKDYVERLLVIQNAQWELAKHKFEEPGGILIGILELIDFYEAILVKLSSFYPKGHFEGKHPKLFFSEQVGARALFHNSITHPFGWSGSIARDSALYDVAEDLKSMISKMVIQLLQNSPEIGVDNLEKWSKAWSNNSAKIGRSK